MLLWLLAAPSALLGLLLLALGLIGVLGVATPNMQGFNPGQSVVISDGGMSVYARSDARAEAVCTGDGPDEQVTFERPVQEYAVDVSGTDFYEIARSPQDLSAGTYAMTCNGVSDAVYAGPWAPDTTSGGLLGPLGIVLGLLLLSLALALAVAAIVLRRRGKPSPTAQHYQGEQGWQGSRGYASPYATPSQPGPAYGSPPPPEQSPDPSGYPYGAPPPPPPGSGYSYGQPAPGQQPPAYGQPSPYSQQPAYGPSLPEEQSYPQHGADTEGSDDDRWQQDTTSAADDEQRWPPPPPPR